MWGECGEIAGRIQSENLCKRYRILATAYFSLNILISIIVVVILRTTTNGELRMGKKNRGNRPGAKQGNVAKRIELSGIMK